MKRRLTESWEEYDWINMGGMTQLEAHAVKREYEEQDGDEWREENSIDVGYE